MNTKTIITILAVGAVAVGAYMYFGKSNTTVKKEGATDVKTEPKSECGGCSGNV